MFTTSFLRVGFAFFFLIWAMNTLAQQPTGALPSSGSTPIDIIHADATTIKKENDSTNLTILEGAVVMKQGNTTFKCDKCIRNDRTKTFEAWGNVHINDSDTTNIYSGHLKYLEDKQIAYLDKSVKLTDGQATLTTPDLEYNMATNIATYKNGGKVVNKKTVITSKEAFYYTDIKDVYFKKNVLVNDPSYKIKTDSLLYNTETQIARFIALTNIRDSTGRTIDTREGYYNLKNGEAQFGQRPLINDGKGATIEADNVSLTDNLAKAEGNAVVIDTINKTTIIGNLIYQNRLTEAVLATQKPLMILKQGEDSIYIAADTLFSARLTDLYIVSPALGGDSIKIKPDSTGLPDSIGNPDLLDSLQVPLTGADSLNSMATIMVDSAAVVNQVPLPSSKDSLQKAVVSDSVARDLVKNVPERIEEIKPPAVTKPPVVTTKPNTTARNNTDSLGLKLNKKPDNDSTNRYFEAFHNVRIFSDSVQAVSDSLFYSFKDSTFRLYYEPVIWGKNSQITGDTILLHTKNKQMDHFEAFKNGFMVNWVEGQAFNQVKSTRIDGYFTQGNMDSLRAKGSAESVYYIQDEDSAYMGINEMKADILDAYFQNKQMYKVVGRSAAEGTLWPMKDKRPSEMQLKGFIWREAERPKTKYDLMQ